MRLRINAKHSVVTPVFAQTGMKYRKDEVLVRFRPGFSEHDKTTAVAAHGGQRKKLRGESGIEKVLLPAGQESASASQMLALNPAVEFAEPNFLVQQDDFKLGMSDASNAGLRQSTDPANPTRLDLHSRQSNQLVPGFYGAALEPLQPQALQPNDFNFNEQWAFRNTGQGGGQYGSDINITTAWQTTTGTPSTTVAVIDSGIDFTHADLINNQWTNPLPGPEGDLHGWDYITDTGAIKDEQGHGTAIAGIIAAQGNNGEGVAGVMWRAGLMSLRVLDNTGTGDVADAVEAIDYAVAHGARVINISWGTSGESLVLNQAIERGISHGVVMVCSAGNSGQDLEANPYYPASFAIKELIVVASTDNFDRLATWSNWGKKTVTIAAPGINILTTKMGGGYWNVTGTSASAPLVTGVAGLIKSLQSSFDPKKIAKAVENEARKVSSLSNKVSSGGVVDASSSLNSLRGSMVQEPARPPSGYGTGGTGPGGTFTTTPPPQTTGAPESNLPNLDEIRNLPPYEPRARQPIQANLMCADCDPQGGGGGGSYYPANDPNFSAARKLPRNEVGVEGVDLGSRNFNWSLPLVSLPGRAGMDLNLSLTYNSLVWTKDGSYMKYNGDLGSPAPGFRLGLPTLQQRFYNPQTTIWAYMMVSPSGSRVEMRQVGQSHIYESQDGSYTQLDDTNTSAILVRTSDGTQLKFQPVTVNNEYRCFEIKDRNGNYITASYNTTTGHLTSITDTLNRTVSFIYDGNNNLQAIRQTWAGVSHDWATFSYGEVYVAPNFAGGILVNGPNGNNVTVLTQVSLHDGSYFTFGYNAAFGQVNIIRRYAPSGAQLSYTSYNLNSSAGQTDCPRFTERHDWATHWNNDAEVITYYSVASDNSWAQQQTTTTGPIYKEIFATSGWQNGLTTGTEVWVSGVRKKWTSVAWTQDDTNLSYQKNPRVTESTINDSDNNVKRVTISYGPYANYSLPYEVIEYAAGGGTMLRRTYTDYNLSSTYTDRRIIGLVSAVHVVDHASGSYVSKTTFTYDQTGEFLTSQSAAQHDDTGYGSGFVAGRGNLTTVTRWDVNEINNSNKAIAQVRTGYNSTGSTIFSRDALGHQTTISYADSFSDATKNGNKYAYPTTITDADNFVSTATYNFDHGATTQTMDPKGARITFEYDTARRLTKVNNLENNAYKRWVYAAGQDYTLMFETINDTQEFYSFTWNDGAGRIHGSGGDLPSSTGGYFVTKTVFDVFGRAVQVTNPTEITGGIIPAGDDAAGFVWTYQTYDWKGRPLVTTNPDGSTRDNVYGGCGCAGGEVTTVRDERGRRRRMTMDVLGRLKQVDELNWDQSTYATTSYAYNSRDQITSSNQAGQTRSFGYDGYGRLTSKTTPEQGNTAYSYYADDAVQTVTDARSAASTFTYNNRHLVTGISYGNWGGTQGASFGYDSAGNRTSMTDGLGSVSYVYNVLSRLTSEARTFTGVGSYTLSYSYNLSGELTSLTNPSNAVVTYNYDKAGRPTSVTGSGYAGISSYASSLTYRAFGLKGMSYANGKTLSVQYDNRMRATQWYVPGVMRWDYSYTNFGENTGRVTYAKNVDEGWLDRSYDYDHVGRLTVSHSGQEARWHIGTASWAIDGPYSQLYSYDQFGNRTHREGWGGGFGPSNIIQDFTYSNNRQVGLTYDAAGNLTSDSQNYTYDATGQQVTAPGLTQSYDGDTMRGKKVENGTTTTYYMRSSVLGGQVVAEINGSGSWTRGFVYLGGQMIALQGGTSGAVTWAHQDPVTKSQRVTNGGGTIISTVDLDPWGGETYRSSNQAFQPHRFTSYDRDTNGSDDAMMRRYQTSQSRFSQPDPYDGSYSAANPQSFNRYTYVQNDPVNFVDPSGLMKAICMPTEYFGDGLWITTCEGLNPFGGYSPKDRGLVDPPDKPPTTEPSADPCDGKKGNLNYFAWRQRADGTPGYADGTYRANEHIYNQHVSTTQNLAKSKYSVGKDKAMNAGAKMWAVNMTNSDTFWRATGFVEAATGNIQYVYAYPDIPNLKGDMERAYVGTDASRNGQGTNVNTLVVAPDCQSVITSHPGPPGNWSNSDPRIGGSMPRWFAPPF